MMGCGRLDISISEVSFGGDRNRITAEVEAEGQCVHQGNWDEPRNMGETMLCLEEKKNQFWSPKE